MDNYRIPAGAGIGHVHLKVADIDRALGFYRDVLGFDQDAAGNIAMHMADPLDLQAVLREAVT
jgi:catechol-2,3-dioxygenase